MSLQLPELEARLQEARAELETAREILDDARHSLDEVEACARAAWSKKKAALHSRAATIAAASACGLQDSRSTLAAVARFQAHANEAVGEIRVIISSSKQVCELFEWAWDTYIAARSKEIDLLQCISDFSTEKPEPPTPPIQLNTIKKDLQEALQAKIKEQVQRKRELSLPDDPHYDPQYDSRELLERKMRPWV
jgi:hypothetical protein